MSKEIKISTVSYEEYTQYEYVDVATFFIVDAMQNYVYFHTSKREEAQKVCDEYYGKGKYTVKASKIQKTKSKLESGLCSAYGTSTRRGQRK